MNFITAPIVVGVESHSILRCSVGRKTFGEVAENRNLIETNSSAADGIEDSFEARGVGWHEA